MLKILLCYIISIITITIVIWYIPTSCCNIHYLYGTNIRSVFFSSFLAMGSFTLSLMTMFMFSLKDKLFDNEKYVQIVVASNNVMNTNINQYKSLVMISRLFLLCVFCCFITSLLQVTIGLIDHRIASSLCISQALTTIGLALFVLINVWKNLEVWFKLLLSPSC